MMIIQTFLTAPMSVLRLKQNLIIAALSLGYAHKSGYKVKMYTDSLGYTLLSRLPYDEINTELDNIELPRDKALFSIGKYYALLKEPLKTIHTDFDVMLKKPCLDNIFNDDTDAVCQIKEYIGKSQPWYEECRQFLHYNNCNNIIRVDKPVNYAYNTGIIGYGSEKMRKAHIQPIMKLYEMFRNCKNIPIIDFYIELANLYFLSEKEFNITPLIKDRLYTFDDYRIINDYADNIGYCHLQSSLKYKRPVMDKVINNLMTEFKDIYDSISDIIKITNNY